MAELPEVLATVVVGPLDRLVIVLPITTTREQFDRMQADLDEHGWSRGGRVMFVAGVEQLVVLRGERDG